VDREIDFFEIDAEEKSIPYNSKLLSDLYLVRSGKTVCNPDNLVKMPLNTRMKAQ
jgi:hypothetical protein